MIPDELVDKTVELIMGQVIERFTQRLRHKVGNEKFFEWAAEGWDEHLPTMKGLLMPIIHRTASELLLNAVKGEKEKGLGLEAAERDVIAIHEAADAYLELVV